MGRLHLFEIEDQKWCPRFIREATTDILSVIFNMLHIYEPAYQKIHEVLSKTNTKTIVDCCSGSAGPIRHLRNYLNKTGNDSVTITLTDKFPHLKSYEELEKQYPQQISSHKQSLDASQLPASFAGMRTFFSSFHHFKPEFAVKLLQDAVNNNVPIGVFESVERRPIDFIRAITSLVWVPILLPFSRRMTKWKFLFTYIIPLIPLSFAFDYIMSNLRAYSVEEMQRLINQLHAPDYQWEVGKLWSNKAKGYVTYLVGYKNPA